MEKITGVNAIVKNMNAYKTNCEKRAPIKYYGLVDSLSFVNPSFEEYTDGTNLNPTFTIIPEANLIGWDSSAGVVEVWQSGFQGVPAVDGDYFIELSPNSPSILSQTANISNSAGVIQWSLYHRGRAGVDNARVEILFDGQVASTEDISTDNIDWVQYSGVVDKPEGVTSVTLQISSLSVGAQGNFLDAIQVSFLEPNDTCNIGWVSCGNQIYDSQEGGALVGELDGALISLDGFATGTLCSSDDDTFATTQQATTAFTTTNGVNIATGDYYIEFPNGDTWDAPTATFNETETFVRGDNNIDIDGNVETLNLYYRNETGNNQAIINISDEVQTGHTISTILLQVLGTPTNVLPIELKETVTSMSFNTGVLTYVDENGDSNNIDIPSGQLREVAYATVNSGQNINDNDVVDVTSQLIEGSWSFNNSQYVYTGSPTYVVINAMTNFTSGNQRNACVVNVEKLIGGIWTQVATSATGYIRAFSGHNQSSHTLFYRDINPGNNPQYRLSSGQEAANGAATTIAGQFDLEAITNI